LLLLELVFGVDHETIDAGRTQVRRATTRMDARSGGFEVAAQLLPLGLAPLPQSLEEVFGLRVYRQLRRGRIRFDGLRADGRGSVARRWFLVVATVQRRELLPKAWLVLRQRRPSASSISTCAKSERTGSSASLNRCPFSSSICCQTGPSVP